MIYPVKMIIFHSKLLVYQRVNDVKCPSRFRRFLASVVSFSVVVVSVVVVVVVLVVVVVTVTVFT